MPRKGHGPQIETSAPVGGVVEIVPRGEIDVDSAHEVREAVAAVLSAGRPHRIELDMHLVTFLDSVGISAMVAAVIRRVGAVARRSRGPADDSLAAHRAKRGRDGLPRGVADLVAVALIATVDFE